MRVRLGGVVDLPFRGEAEANKVPSAPRPSRSYAIVLPSTAARGAPDNVSSHANCLPSNCLRRDGVRRIGQRRAVTRGRVRCRRYFQGCPRPGRAAGGAEQHRQAAAVLSFLV